MNNLSIITILSFLTLLLVFSACKKKAPDQPASDPTKGTIKIHFTQQASNVGSVMFKFAESADKQQNGQYSFSASSNNSWSDITINDVKPATWYYDIFVNYTNSGPGEFQDTIKVEAGKTSEITW